MVLQPRDYHDPVAMVAESRCADRSKSRHIRAKAKWVPLSESPQLLTVGVWEGVEWQGGDSLQSRLHGTLDFIDLIALLRNA